MAYTVTGGMKSEFGYEIRPVMEPPVSGVAVGGLVVDGAVVAADAVAVAVGVELETAVGGTCARVA